MCLWRLGRTVACLICIYANFELSVVLCRIARFWLGYIVLFLVLQNSVSNMPVFRHRRESRASSGGHAQSRRWQSRRSIPYTASTILFSTGSFIDLLGRFAWSFYVLPLLWCLETGYMFRIPQDLSWTRNLLPLLLTEVWGGGGFNRFLKPTIQHNCHSILPKNEEPVK